jgi:glycosyltransferase involved in cell wall biosynthesis
MQVDLQPLSAVQINPCIARQEIFQQPVAAPQASVIIVAYNTNRELLRCLEMLQAQSQPDFEIILVDNGGNETVLEELKQHRLWYFRLKENFRPSLARNVGIAHARGETVIFLDDDALAEEDYVAQHLLAHQQPGTLGVRGKVLPKSKSTYNKLALMYNLGNQAIPSYIDLEGNASFPRQALLEVGGFNPAVFAGEGVELSYRLVRRFGGRDKLIYWPGAVIYHDYADGLRKYLRKNLRGAKMQVYLEHLYPDFWDFVESYHPFPPMPFPTPDNLQERIHLALLRSAGRWTRRLGAWWYCKQ